MPNPRISVYSADGTVQVLDADNPLAVQTVPAGGGADVDAADLLHTSGTTAALGQTQLVAAPGAGVRIVVSSFLIQNTTANATTVIMQAGGVNTYGPVLLQAQASSFSGLFPVGREWKLPANTALNVNLSAANLHNYNATYYTEPV